MNAKLIALIFCTLFLFCAVKSQVTIGSDKEPNNGTLLDLTQGATTTKGLGLPRVHLTDLNKLYPMLSSYPAYLNDENGEVDKQNLIHTGLVVYNTPVVQGTAGCLTKGAMTSGVWIWNGTEWIPLGSAGFYDNSRTGEVSTITDTRDIQNPQIYKTGKFGSNWWMLENLRASVWPDASKTFIMIGNSSNATDPYIYYPNNDSNLSGQYGNLYNWHAATRNQNVSTTDESLSGPTKNIQGICPIGWHLPTNTEWNQLIAEVTANPCKYGTDPDGSHVGFNLEATTSVNLQATLGTTRPYTEGGFNSLPVGKANGGGQVSNYGTQGHYWTSSSVDLSNAWRKYITTADPVVYEGADQRASLLSIRCVEDPATCDCCGLIDSEGNTYSTARFGTAGCWMTQNLRSTKNEIINTLQENKNPSNNTTTPYYYYPKNDKSLFLANPEYGLLYTWPAANAGTDRFEEVDGRGAGSKSTRQGICPDGWVFPSDKDWEDLEVEMKSSPLLYSTNSSWGYAQTTMKSPIVVLNGEGVGGLGASFTNGLGFNGLLVGGMYDGAQFNYSRLAYYWTASYRPGQSPWHRSLNYEGSGIMGRTSSGQGDMLSVRCKKLE